MALQRSSLFFLHQILVWFLLVAIAESQETETNLEFPKDRLDVWVEFLDRVPKKFGMHRDCSSTGTKHSFYVAQHGLLLIMSKESVRLESIQNNRYNAQVRVNSNGSYALVKVGEPIETSNMQNLFHNVSILGKGLFIPDLIAKGHLKLVSVKNVDNVTRYEFIPNGGGIPEKLLGISLEFDAEFELPVMAEHRILNEKQEIFQRSFYSDFKQINDEWLPGKLSGGLGNEGGYFHEVPCELSYDSAAGLGPERFLLSFYGIEEPALAQTGGKRTRWIWILITVCLCGVILVLKCIRWKER
jgi:hypothetical protein